MFLAKRTLKLLAAAAAAIAFVVAFYAFASNPIDSLLSESSWSSSIHRVFGWGNTVHEINHSFSEEELRDLQQALNATSFRNRTVILTTLNSAWAAEHSMIDLFLSSFRLGNRTRGLLDHLLIVALDEAAYSRCLDIHWHCFMLKTDGVDFKSEKFFMSADYLKMMWRRIDFLRVVLELGYDFVFSDADILWFQDPFQHFSPTADFEIACDHFTGDPLDPYNKPNGGFVHARANQRSIQFYKTWYASRLLYPGKHDQDVLDVLKFQPHFRSMKARFLSTEIFANFCEISMSSPATACTMHANCCKGLDKKLLDLRGIIRDWTSSLKLRQQEPAIDWSPLRCPKRKKQWLVTRAFGN